MLYRVWYEFTIGTDKSVRRYQPPNLRAWRPMDLSDTSDELLDAGPGKERSYFRDGMSERQLKDFLDACQLYSGDHRHITADEPYVEFTTDGENSSGEHWYSSATVLPIPEPDKGETEAMQLQDALRIQKRYAPGWCVIDCQRCKRLMAGDERGGWIDGRFDGDKNYHARRLVCQSCYAELERQEESGQVAIRRLQPLGPTE